MKEAIRGIYMAFSVSYPPIFPEIIPPKIMPKGRLVTTTDITQYNRVFSSLIKSPFSR